MTRTRARMVLIGLLLFGLVWPAGGASAKAGRVEKSGPCTVNSDWKLKAAPENGKIEVEFEVDSNVAGQSWKVKLLKNGNVFFSGTRMTQAPSGSFTVRRLTPNPPGTDTIKGRARNPASDEVCTGKLQFAA